MSDSIVSLDFINISLDSANILSYASTQNKVPIIHQLKLENTSSIDIKDLELIIGSNPDFIEGQRFKFEKFLAGEIRSFDQEKLNLGPNNEYLFKLNEAENGSLIIKITAPGFTEVIKNIPIEILARNEWGGVRGLPELMAAHVQPNNIHIDRLISEASKLFKVADSGLAMDGYQSKNRERVWKQVNAIYKVICGLGIHYAPPPASFEKFGQKIRTTEQLLEGKIATCLDSTVLFASCFEQAGLNAVVLFKDGHSWVGVWLVETSFSLSITDTVQTVRKRTASGELLMIETTLITHKLSPSMKHAKDVADAYLEEEPITFEYALDIKRSREAHIRPMKSVIEREPVIADSVKTEFEYQLEDMPSLPPIDPGSLEPTELETPKTPQGRINNWKSKLLDLTLRNKLLNFKPTKKFLKIVTHSISELEDKLAGGGEFKLSAKPLLMQENDPRSEALFRQENGTGTAEAHAKKVLSQAELVFDCPSQDFTNILTEIFRDGKNTIEETGSNSLYVAIGMLYWKETPESETTLKAPILLVPVKLKRGAVGAGIRLERLDEDTIFNPTLIQKLLNTFEIALPYIDGLLPTDHSGVDVEKILQTLRTKVQDLEGFEVRDDCYLGSFSFTKYVMWRDLESNTDKLKQSKVVNHLINHYGESFKDEHETVFAEDLDSQFLPHTLYTPLLCDSSQLAVICTADRGKNMVVEGPPGTGKSQTITNLISHSLAHGKTVLFVAEKMAALEVVHKRLQEIGLDEFCLELHSAKAKKSEIAKQFVQTLDSTKGSLITSWEIEAEKIASLRNELNSLVDVLHKEHRNGLNVYEAIGIGIKYQAIESAKFNWTSADIHDAKEFAKLKDFVGHLSALASRLTDISNHPLKEIKEINWTPTWEANLLDASNKCSMLISNLEAVISDFSAITPVSVKSISFTELEGLDELVTTILQACQMPIESIEHAFNANDRKKLSILIDHGKERARIWEHFSQYLDELKNLDANLLKIEWLKADKKVWPLNWLNKRKITTQIKLFNKENKRLNNDQVSAFIEILATLNNEDKYLVSNLPIGEATLGELFKLEKTDWVLAENTLAWMNNLSRSVSKIYQTNQDTVEELRSKLKSKLVNQIESFEKDGLLFNAAVDLKSKISDFNAIYSELEKLTNSQNGQLIDKDQIALFSKLNSIITNWKINRTQLQPWCVWNNGRNEAFSFGIEALIQQVENGYANLENLSVHFERSYADWWLRKIMDSESLLSGFSGASHEHKIGEFQKADAKFQELTKEYVRAVLKGKIPVEREIQGNLATEIGLLRREAQKQRQHKSIRELIKSVSTSIPRLKPCMLMSPQSVAQYLEAGSTLFDIVIFDEASQIPTWDAIGAISRGKQLICVGDPKQLPPTNFFNASDSDGATEDESVQEMESILDECLGVGLPLSRLSWHYRSKNEGLITFSNFQYYENSLVTFPSPIELDKSVEFIDSRGIYEPGKSRTNKREAELIVEEIANHFLSGLGSKFSLGVITFNSTQQALIEKLLDEKRLRNRELDLAISESDQEEMFIKNLENVQGDERDYIFFSITYGKDANGKISMNFGPMNKEGGHRRLNVAASRARYKVKIFSSLRPEDIDLSRTNARGVADLKAYLDFSLNGPRVLANQFSPTDREPDSPFEVVVINALRDKGWDVVPQVGVSGYRIDMAVKNRKRPGTFLLGIECDGATYHSAPSARDRDRLRQLILEGLGWKIHRIWSTDWWFNPEIPLKTLCERLNKLESEFAE